MRPFSTSREARCARGGWGIVQHGRPYNCSVGRLGPSGVEREKGWRVEARCARGLGNRPTRTTLVRLRAHIDGEVKVFDLANT
jgi:hypothetical protein